MQIIHYTDTKRLQASLLNIQSNQSHFYFYRTKEHAQHRRAASRPRSDAMLLCSKREDAALASSALWGECRLIVWNDQRNKPHILAVWKASPERISGALSPPLSPPNAPPLPSLPPPLLSFEAPSLSSSQGAQKGGCRRGAEVIVIVRGGVRSPREGVERGRDGAACAITHWCESARAGGANVGGPHGNALERLPNKPTLRS